MSANRRYGGCLYSLCLPMYIIGRSYNIISYIELMQTHTHELNIHFDRVNKPKIQMFYIPLLSCLPVYIKL